MCTVRLKRDVATLVHVSIYGYIVMYLLYSICILLQISYQCLFDAFFADSPEFRDRVRKYPSFFVEARNLFMVMCADGIAPFNKEDGTSVTPICFSILNYPSHLRGKKEYIMTWGIYEGKESHKELRKGHKMESKPFFNLLVDELLELWHDGVIMYDVLRKESFKLKVMLYKALMDYKGHEDVARRTGSNSYAGCIKCNIRGAAKNESQLNKIIYSELFCHGTIFAQYITMWLHLMNIICMSKQ